MKVFYISSSFWLVGVESRDFSHADKERTACKDEQIHKMTTIFTQKVTSCRFEKKLVVEKYFFMQQANSMNSGDTKIA